MSNGHLKPRQGVSLLAAAALLILSLMAAGDAAVADGNELTSDTVVAIVHGKPIKYGYIRYPDSMAEAQMKFQKVSGEAAKKKIQRQSESLALSGTIMEMIRNDYLEKHNLTATQAQIDEMVAQAFRKKYGKDRFTEADADAIIKKEQGKVTLLELRLRDEKQADELWRKDYQEYLSASEWEMQKKFYGTKERVDSLKARTKPVSVESVYAQLKKNAKNLQNYENFKEGLVKNKAIAKPEEAEAWLERQVLAETKSLHPEYDLKQYFVEKAARNGNSKSTIWLAAPEPGKAKAE